MSEDGLGRLANLTLEATATLPSGPRAVRSLNDPTDVGANDIAAYTPLWGTYTRTRGVQGVDQRRRGDRHRRQGRRRSTRPRAGAGELPANSLRARRPRGRRGRHPRAARRRRRHARLRPQERHRRQAARSPSAATSVLVKDGIPQPGAGGRRVAPRTAIGFKDGGKTLLLVTADGRQSLVLGPTAARRLAELMADLGAETALNLDGGGSTTMIARAARQPARDGAQRRRPTAASAPTRTASASSSRPATAPSHDLAITPEDARVFPGLRRTLHRRRPSTTTTRRSPAGDVTWTGGDATCSPPRTTPGTVTVRAKSGSRRRRAPTCACSASR